MGQRLRMGAGIVGLLVVAAVSGGCISLSDSDRIMLEELKACGIAEDAKTVKSPALAGALNILPGFGNFYLAYGSGEPQMWTIGFLNLLVWPYSIIWGVPEAAIDADTINKRHTVNYYKFHPLGMKELDELKARVYGKPVIPEPAPS